MKLAADYAVPDHDTRSASVAAYPAPTTKFETVSNGDFVQLAPTS